jgi:predicted nucleic acid-binding protein
MTKRVVALDACVLIHAVQGLRGASGDHASEAARCLALIEDLDEAGAVVVVPAPAYAEFLTGGNSPATPEERRLLEERFRIAPFDGRAAAIAARIAATYRGAAIPDGDPHRQMVKADFMILAVAVAVGADTIFTTDGTLDRRALGLIRVAPVPEFAKKVALFPDADQLEN